MNITFIPNTKIAYVDTLASEDTCDSLFDLVKWIDSRDVKYTTLNASSADDLLLLDSRATPEEHISIWEKRNIYTEDLPETYIAKTFEISNAANEAMSRYLEIVNGESTPFREIAFDVIHIWRKDDGLDEHLDCFNFGLVYYLNSPSDWEGGELYFPKLDLELVPVKGRLLIIPSNVPHLVKPITAGLRANMTHFVPLGIYES